MKYLKLKFLLMFFALAMAIPPAWAAEVTVTKTVNQLKDEYGWTISTNIDNQTTVGSIVTDFNLNNDINISTDGVVQGTTYCGSIWQRSNNDATLQWRLYRTAGGNVIVKTLNNCTLKSVKIVYDSNNNGVLLSADERQIQSGQEEPVSGSIVTFGIGNTNNKTNGQVRITEFTVTYETPDTPQPTTPWLTFTPEELTIGEGGGTLTVNGNKLSSDPGVFRVDEGYSNQFLATLQGVNQGQTWFPRVTNDELDNGVSDQKVVVTYDGRELTATGKFGVASDNASAYSIVTYQPDLYIYDDNSGSWNFTTASKKMEYDNGVYTGTIITTRENACIMFGRTTGVNYGWDNDYNRLFFGANSNGDWEYGTNTSGSLETNPSDNGRNKYSPIKFPNAGVYTITINAKAKTFSIVSTSVANIAEAQTFEGDTFTYMGNAIVTYQNGENLWIRDNANNSGLIVGTVNANGLVNGDILAAGWTAENDIQYYYIPIFSNPNGVAKGEGTAVADPFPLTKLDREADVNKYASMSGVTVTAVDRKKYTVTLDGNESVLYDQFSLFTSTPLEVGNKYNVEGVVSVYSGTPQLYLTKVEEIKELKVTLDPEAKSATTGEAISVTVTVENAVGDYTISYKIGENGTPTTLTDGNVINVTSETAGEVKLYVTVTNGDNQATAQGTYTFTEPVQPGSNVFVKVTSADQLVAGKKYIIVCGNKAMGTEPTGNFLTAIDVTAGDEVEAADGVAIMTLAGTLGHYTLALGDNYLHATSNTALGFGTATEWAISNFNGSLAGFRVKHADYDRAVRYSSGYNRFGNYATSDAASDYGWIYVEKATTPQPEPLAVTLTPASGNYTVGDEAKVKVTVENAVGESDVEYVASYTVNKEDKTQTLTADTEGYVTLPNDKAVTVTLTVTALDSRPDAEVVEKSGSYTFNAAPAITFTMNTTETSYTVGDKIKVKVADVQNAIGEYDVTYMIGETTLKPDEEGYVTIPSDEAGKVVLTVTVEDLYDHASEATQTITFNIAAGGPISITLTADPEAENYTVGDVVNVKVTTNGTIGNDNDVLITYTTDFESKAESTYDPKKGIDITSDKAGDVTLTVNVYDGYAHEGADENGITTKTAKYTFVKAPAINITFDPASGTKFTVGQEAKVKVTIAGAADDYEAEYKIGDNVVEPVDGYIVLPNTATDDVTLTVSVYDGIDRIGADESGFTTATATYTFSPMPVVAAPTFSLVAGTYGEAQQLTITAENGANILYSTDGSEPTTPYNGAISLGEGTTTVKAVATKDGFAKSPVVTATYIIDIPEELPTITPFKGYFQIKNNENNKYANIAGRKTLNFTNAENAKKMAGTVIWLETNEKGQVQSIRSQAADLQGYANRAMRYVPQMVDIVVNKINEMEGIEDATGAGSVLGENGLKEIMAKFNECFDYHLYVEQAQGGWRLYGKTPNMQHVVDFYRDHKDQVEAKLPKLEQFINDALHKLINKIGGSTVFTDFSLHQIWKNMGGNLPEPVVGDDAAIMDFYRAVLNNKNYVWDFAYQTAQIYWGNVKSHPRYEELKAQLGEYADYIDEFVTQVRPDFKYYVIQRGDEPDYISEGNGEIINNDPRTLWTLEPRTDFTVNIAGEQFGCPYAGGVGGYATTNYTDFAYTVPEGVTAYKVASVENGVANLQALSGVIPAQTPVLLMAKTAGDYVLKLSTEAGTKVTDNLLVGVDSLITRFQLKTPMVETLFNIAQGVLGEQLYNQYVAQYEYLQLLYAGTVNNKYFWGLNNEDAKNCVYINAEGKKDRVIRNLGTGAFVNDYVAPKTNKAFLVSETDQTITISTLRGDVNHDGYVNIKDVTDLIDRLLGDESHSCSYCSDVNSSNDVNIKDVTDLIDILLRSGANTHIDPPTPDPEGGNGN